MTRLAGGMQREQNLRIVEEVRRRRGRRVGLAVFAIAMAAAGPTWADQVHLSNGQVLDGIVLRQSDAQVVLQVAWESHIILDRETVVKIDTVDEAARTALLNRWHEDYQAFRKRDERQQAFEESQRAKGLVFYRGEWLTKEEVQAIKTDLRHAEAERAKREAAEESLKREEEVRKKLEGELAALTQRLQGMQVEQARLQQEITSLRQLLSRRHRRWPLPRRWPRFVRDPGGRILRVAVDASGTAVELTDGTRCELVFDGATYSYIDRNGVVHSVEPSDAED